VEGTSILPTALPFARRCPRWILAGAKPREGLQTSRTIAPATRVPGAPRGGHARCRSRHAHRLLSSASARDLPSGRSWLAGLGAATHRKANATGIGWCRQLACEGRRLVGCARASYTGCRSRQASPRLERSAYPVATERVNGSPADGARKDRVGEKASTTCLAVAKPRGRGRPEPGARKGVAGRRSLSYGRHPGPFSHTYRFTRAVGGGLGGDHRDTERASASGAR